MKVKRKEQGITLITLVITIIVLLILAAVSIATLTGENGILTKASEAKNQITVEQEKEQIKLAYSAALMKKDYNASNVTADDLNDELDKLGADVTVRKEDNSIKVTFNKSKNAYTIDNNGKVSEPSNTEGNTGTTEPSTIKEAKSTAYTFSKKTNLSDEYGNQVMVPEGFKIASDSAEVVTGGVVIEDANHGETEGSQFVWIPVGTIYTNAEKTASKTVELNRYTFASDGTPTAQGENVIDSKYQELATSSYGNTIAKDINAFKTSVGSKGGYYIGRYEAGDPNATAERTESSSRTGTMVCKANQFVYNYVTQPEAASLARNMYSSSNFTSDLMNSYAWDTAIVFIQEFSGDGDYSSQSGLQYILAKTGQATDGTNKDERCNIYDMAGNTVEWTTETSSFSNNPCTIRGCYYDSGIGDTSYRGLNLTTTADIYGSFRVALYL